MAADAAGRVPHGWAEAQVLASADFAHGSWLWTHFSGGLNYQARPRPAARAAGGAASRKACRKTRRTRCAGMCWAAGRRCSQVVRARTVGILHTHAEGGETADRVDCQAGWGGAAAGARRRREFAHKRRPWLPWGPRVARERDMPFRARRWCTTSSPTCATRTTRPSRRSCWTPAASSASPTMCTPPCAPAPARRRAAGPWHACREFRALTDCTRCGLALHRCGAPRVCCAWLATSSLCRQCIRCAASVQRTLTQPEQGTAKAKQP